MLQEAKKKQMVHDSVMCGWGIELFDPAGLIDLLDDITCQRQSQGADLGSFHPASQGHCLASH